ncbi:hypothetical protein PTKIN_Ptkin09bG0214600 [Pterospermum kingtungense]
MGGTHGSRLVFLLAATLLVSVSEELNSEGQYLLEFTVLKMNSTFFQIGTPLMGHHGDGLVSTALQITNPWSEYAYTMKVTEKCDTYSYGVVLLELLTGKTPVQPLDQGGDLVTRVRHYVREHWLTAGILDDRLNLDDKSIVDHMITVLKIALICTSMSPFDRPSMREVVLMLIESKRKEGNFNKSPTCDLPLRHNCDESM